MRSPPERTEAFAWHWIACWPGSPVDFKLAGMRALFSRCSTLQKPKKGQDDPRWASMGSSKASTAQGEA